MRILGNEKLLSQVNEILRGGRLFHACIISGPEGIGKKAMAKYIAAGAVCSENEPPCGRCYACLKVEKDIHPDIDYIRPDGTQIKVSQIRDMRSSLHILPNEAPRRVAIIENAERMNDSSQNAILKILEEPPSSVIILLVTENESELLTTILSRCIRFRMQPISEDAIKQELIRRNSDISEAQAEVAARMSGGNLGNALELVEKEGDNDIAERIVRAIADVSTKDLIYLAVAIEKGVKRDKLTDIIEDLRNLLSQAVALSAGRSNPIYPDDVRRISERYEKNRIIKMIELCSKMIGYCEANVGVGHITGTFVSLISEDIEI